MWKKVAVIALLGVAVGLPVMLTEKALHIPADRRYTPDRSKAEEIAAATHARFSEAAIAAADGALLRGWTFLPSPEQDTGKAVLLLHGAGDTRRGMLGFARFFAQRGFTTLVPDSRGHGVSGGGYVTYGLLEKHDVHRWADYLLGVRPNAQLYGLGMSMGAAILIQSLETEPRLRSIVAEGSYATFRAAAAERIPRLTGLPPIFSPPVLSAAFLYARTRYGYDLDAASPLDTLRKAHTPVLLIHGLADDRTAPYQSRLLLDANPNYAELWEVPGAKHTRASEVAKQEFEDRVLRWFQK
jgi:dipeptidyl aminopeptidase/acylaminoacyl peptidase